MSEFSKAEFWSNRYINHETGWDEGKPHDCWVKLAESFSEDQKQKTALVVGAGRGHDAHFLAPFFKKMIAVDFSPEAQKEFKKTYPDSKVEYHLKDVLQGLDNLQADVVFEHTCLCAIDYKRRAEYFATLTKLLPKGGIYHAVLFTKANEPKEGNTPPFTTPLTQVTDFLTKSNFTVLETKALDVSFENREGYEECYLKAVKL